MNKNEKNFSTIGSNKESCNSSREEDGENEIQLDQIFKIYKYKLNKIKSYYDFKSQVDKFWQLLEKNFEGEIERKSFILLFSKIYRLILPIYNHKEILEFIEDEWRVTSRGRSTLEYEGFSKYLFKFVHTWATHISKEEYIDLLSLIYQRITKFSKLLQNLEEVIYTPSIRVRVNKVCTDKEFNEKSWENFFVKETFDETLMEYHPDMQLDINTDGSSTERNLKRRPMMGDEYTTDSQFIIYTEEVFYDDNEAMTNLGQCESLKPVLLNDDEIVILGYPTQHILALFKNDLSLVKKNMNQTDYNMEFTISGSSLSKFYFCFSDEAISKVLIETLKDCSSFILTRDYFSLNEEIEVQSDFTDEELNMYNNLRRNNQLDRYLNFQEIITPTGKQIVNVDQLIIAPIHKKALESTILKEKIGIKSKLWIEKISDKIEDIIKNKFRLIHKKLLYFLLNSSSYSSVIEIITEEIDSEKGKRYKEITEDYEYFKNFDTKKGIKIEKLDSDFDIIEEANTKSPIVLIIGPPLCGKSKICKKLEEDLNMVYLDPNKYFENIFSKVAKFEEDMLNWEESVEDNQDQDEIVDNVDNHDFKPKKLKPGVDSALTALEFAVYSDLTQGREVSEENLTNVYKHILNSNAANSKGVIIDQNSCLDNSSFAEKLLNLHYGNISIDYIIELNLPEDELLLRKSSIKLNLKNSEIISSRDIELMSYPKQKKKETFIDEPKEEGDEEEISEPIEISDEMKETIPQKSDLFVIKDFDEIFKNQCDYYYNIQYPKFKELITKLKKNYYLEINLTGLDYDEASDLIKKKLDYVSPPRPMALPLEEADYKTLLTNNLDGIAPFRRWSLWKQIDPVALKDNFVILNGSTSFAAEYCQRVFLFISEENKNKFLENTKYYLKTPPVVPKNYRVCVLGPMKSGKNTISDMLSQIYGWKKINLGEIYENVKEHQRNLFEQEPNSVYSSRIHFSANEFKELMMNKKGEKKSESLYTRIVFMLDYLGIKLDKKKTFVEYLQDRKYKEDKLSHMFNKLRKKKEEEEELNENVLNTEEMEVEEKKKELDEIKNNTLEKINHNEVVVSDVDVINSEPEVEVDPFPYEEDYDIEDLRTDQLFYQFNEDGTLPRPGGFIMINHPNSQEEIDKFFEFNIVFDKVIYLVDQSEEQPKELALRRIPNLLKLDEDKQQFELEKLKGDIAKYDEILAALREKYNQNNEDCVIEVNCADSLENIRQKLIQAFDPFNVRPDPEDKVYNQSDINSEDKVAIPRGEYGIFCPVTYKEEKWLFYSPEEHEVQVNHRRYRFSSEKEMEKFKSNPLTYLNIKNSQNETGYNSLKPVEVLSPHIFITGYQGGGVSFYTNMLSKEYKLKKKELKKEFMDIWTDQSVKRKQYRVITKREELNKKNEEILQNNALNPENEPQELIDTETELLNDAALDEEAEGFMAVENDKAIFKKLFTPDSASVYDTNWYDLEEKIQTSFLEFIIDTKRVPNVFVIIKVSLRAILERHLHLDQIKINHKILEEKSIQKKKIELEKLIMIKKEEILEKLKEELLDMSEMNVSNINVSNLNSIISHHSLPELQEIKIDLSQEEIDEIMLAVDPDLPELESLITQEREKLVSRYERNQSFLSGFVESLKEKLIPVIEINNDLKYENVYKNLQYQLKPYITNRENFIEKQLVSKFPKLTLRKKRDLINSQIYKMSVNNRFSTVNPGKLSSSENHCTVYRDRLYFFNNEDEVNRFCEEPLKYRSGNEFPSDCYPISSSINGKRDIIYSIGISKSGKSTISNILKELGYYKLSLRKAVYDVMESLNDCLLKRDIKEVLSTGSSIDDNLAIRIISRRISMEDLTNRNIVIDGFPYTFSQARLITENEKNLYPTFVFVCEAEAKTVLKRCQEQPGFKGIPHIIHERLQNSRDHLRDIVYSFKNKEVDIKYLNCEKSKWHLKESIVSMLENKLQSELRFANNFNSGSPALLRHMLPRKILINISFIQKELQKLFLYSPVSLKVANEFHYSKSIFNSSDNFVVYYNKNFYYLKSDEEVALFMKNPQHYDTILYKTKDDIKPPKIMSFEKIAKIIHSEIDRDQDNTKEGSENLSIEKDITNCFELQSCCPVTFSQEQSLKQGKLQYVAFYKEKMYRFESAEKMLKFTTSPEKYYKIAMPVKKNLNDDPKHIEYKVNFENAVNYLEINFGSLITKGMLELNKNRIKYPYLSVKESAIKYLALFLKANNPNNNEYGRMKYTKKFEEFMSNAKLPFDLLNTHERYHKDNQNVLRKQLVKKQLDNLAVKYDELKEKAKNQKNTRFENFFKN